MVHAQAVREQQPVLAGGQVRAPAEQQVAPVTLLLVLSVWSWIPNV
jgi:hypothetical protein